MKCEECEKETDKLYKGVCVDCYLKFEEMATVSCKHTWEISKICQESTYQSPIYRNVVYVICVKCGFVKKQVIKEINND